MNYTPQQTFYKKRPFGDKLNATFVFIRENARPFLKVQLLIAGPILLLMTILINQFSFDVVNLGFSPDDLSASDLLSMFKLYGLLIVSGIITSAIMPAITFSYMSQYQSTSPEMIRNSDITSGLGSRLFNLIGYNLLTTLILGAVAFILAFAIGFSASASAFLVVLFGFALLLSVIYIAVTLSLGPAIIVFEKNNPIDAIGRSFRLIQGKWWSTFGLIIVVGILATIINQLFGLPRAVFFGIKAFSSFEEGGDLSNMIQMSSGDQALNILFSVFETFGSIVTNSLIFIAIAFQYFNLVERKESRGLMTQIEQLDDESKEDGDEVY